MLNSSRLRTVPKYAPVRIMIRGLLVCAFRFQLKFVFKNFVYTFTGITKKTAVVKSELNPAWNEVFSLPNEARGNHEWFSKNAAVQYTDEVPV